MITDNTNKEKNYVLDRDKRTPKHDACVALGIAHDFWLHVARIDPKAIDDPSDYFTREFFSNAYDDPATDGDLSVTEIGTFGTDEMPATDKYAPFALLEVMGVIVDYVVQSLKSAEEKNILLAWTYASDAQYWAGVLTAELAKKQAPSQVTINAYNAVRAKLEKDPKQLAKKEIEKEYQNVNNQFKRRGFTAQFNRDMHIKYPVITDIKTIERLTAELNKSNELIPPKLVKKVFT